MKYFFFAAFFLLISGCDSLNTLTGATDIELYQTVSAGDPAIAQIKNSYNTVIRLDTLSVGTKVYIWDEKDQSGNLVADGIYIIKVNTKSGILIGEGTAVIHR